MKNKTIAIYIFIDDLLKKIGHDEPISRKTSDAEIITVALISGLFFHGHIDNAINFVRSHGYMPNMLSKSRFNRRIHAIYDLVINLFFKISVAIKKLCITSEYSIDSFPVPVCENIRIARSKIVKGNVYRGFKASKRQYFYGFTVQVIATIDRVPVEFAIHPGSIHDSEGMKYLFYESLENSTIYGDSAYTDYLFEEQLKEIENIKFMIARKSNSKRKHDPWQEYIINVSRKGIETMFSQITSLFPKRIHAVTAKGFMLKLVIFIFVFMLNSTIL